MNSAYVLHITDTQHFIDFDQRLIYKVKNTDDFWSGRIEGTTLMNN
jgi:hypothetical protein